MDWQRAKKMTLVVLVVINLLMAILNYFTSNNSTVNTQEKNIKSLFTNNNIDIVAPIKIENEPMSRLEVRLLDYTVDEVSTIFFDKENIKLKTEENKEIYTNDNNTITLSIEGVSAIWENTQLFESDLSKLSKIPQQEAIAIAQSKIKDFNSIYSIFKNLKFTKAYSSKGNFNIDTENEDFFSDWIVEFSVNTSSGYIFSGGYKFYVNENGVYKIEFNYVDISNSSNNEEKDVVDTDEALLSFMIEWLEISNQNNIIEQPITSFRTDIIDNFVNPKNEYILKNSLFSQYNNVPTEIHINPCIEKIEVGYYLLEQNTFHTGSSFYLEPCFGFYLQDNSIPWLVDAYTGQFITH